MLGHAKACRLYLDEVSLTAQQALELGIVDHISEPESLDKDGCEIAERFAAYDRRALMTMMKAMELAELDLATYLAQVGTGF